MRATHENKTKLSCTNIYYSSERTNIIIISGYRFLCLYSTHICPGFPIPINNFRSNIRIGGYAIGNRKKNENLQRFKMGSTEAVRMIMDCRKLGQKCVDAMENLHFIPGIGPGEKLGSAVANNSWIRLCHFLDFFCCRFSVAFQFHILWYWHQRRHKNQKNLNSSNRPYESIVFRHLNDSKSYREIRNHKVNS